MSRVGTPNDCTDAIGISTLAQRMAGNHLQHVFDEWHPTHPLDRRPLHMHTAARDML